MNIAMAECQINESKFTCTRKGGQQYYEYPQNEKGIIHTTSSYSLQYIRNVSKENAVRFIETGSKLDRIEVMQKHLGAPTPTVLISPSLYLGVDLKEDLSDSRLL